MTRFKVNVSLELLLLHIWEQEQQFTIFFNNTFFNQVLIFMKQDKIINLFLGYF